MKQRGFLNREEAMQEASNAYHGADSILSVHRASSLPGNIHAQAFTRFPEIHMASTAESCFTHELGHAVQQMMSPITANKHIKGNAIQDHAFLEKEADTIGDCLKRIPVKQHAIAHTSPSVPASAVLQPAWILEENGDCSYRLEDLKLTWYQNKQQPDKLYYITDDVSSPYAPLSGKSNAATWITWYQRKPDSSLLRAEIVERWDSNTKGTLLFYIDKKFEKGYHHELDDTPRMERAATLIAIGLQWNTAFSSKQIQDKVLPILSADPIFTGITTYEIKTVFELSGEIKGAPELYMTNTYREINTALMLMLGTQGDEVDTDENHLKSANLLALNWKMNLLTPYQGNWVGRGEDLIAYKSNYKMLYKITNENPGIYKTNEIVVMNKIVSTFYDKNSKYSKKSLQWSIKLLGKHGAYIPKNEQKYAEEYEVMLPPGTRLQVDEIHYTTDKIMLYAHTLDYQGVPLKYKTKAK